MKNQTQQAKAGFHKKHAVVGLLCLLLVFGIGISAALLGGGLGRFSRGDDNVIPLVPTEAALSGNGDAATLPQSGTAPTQPAPQSGTSPQPTPAATAPTFIRQPEYRGELLVYDEKQVWKTETRVNLFRNSYDGTVDSEDGEKVIAPGTSNFYDFTLKNNGNIPLDYSVSLEVETYFGEDEKYPELPLEWRLLAGNGAVLTEWKNYNDRTEVLKRETLPVRHQDNYTIEWRWAFEREGMDEEDTSMGNLAVEHPIGVNAAIYVSAEQSAGWHGPGELPNTGDTFHLTLWLTLLAGAALGLLILFTVRKKHETNKESKI